MRLLLAEDNKNLSGWLAKALRQSGYAVDWMYDGGDADHVLLTQHYDAVILDLNLPTISGLEVLRRLGIDPLPNTLLWSKKIAGPVGDNPIMGPFFNSNLWGLNK